jgi:hypothetical protein
MLYYFVERALCVYVGEGERRELENEKEKQTKNQMCQ